MFLGFAKNEIAYEITGIVGRYHAALLTTNAGLNALLCAKNSLLLFVFLDSLAVCWNAIYKPISRRFNKIIPP